MSYKKNWYRLIQDEDGVWLADQEGNKVPNQLECSVSSDSEGLTEATVTLMVKTEQK